MSAKQGLKWFSQTRAETIMIKLEQLVYQKVMERQQAKTAQPRTEASGIEVAHASKTENMWEYQGVGMCRWVKAAHLQAQQGNQFQHTQCGDFISTVSCLTEIRPS